MHPDMIAGLTSKNSRGRAATRSASAKAPRYAIELYGSIHATVQEVQELTVISGAVAKCLVGGNEVATGGENGPKPLIQASGKQQGASGRMTERSPFGNDHTAAGNPHDRSTTRAWRVRAPNPGTVRRRGMALTDGAVHAQARWAGPWFRSGPRGDAPHHTTKQIGTGRPIPLCSMISTCAQPESSRKRPAAQCSKLSCRSGAPFQARDPCPATEPHGRSAASLAQRYGHRMLSHRALRPGRCLVSLGPPRRCRRRQPREQQAPAGDLPPCPADPKANTAGSAGAAGRITPAPGNGGSEPGYLGRTNSTASLASGGGARKSSASACSTYTTRPLCR